jgi:acyl-CoA thioesterase
VSGYLMEGELSLDLKQRLASMSSAPFALCCDIETISVGGGEAVVRMPVDGKLNALGTVHGGAIFSLADQAFALAANASGDPQVALSASINYLKPARGTLIAHARLVGENKSTSVYEVLVHDGDCLVAVFQGTGYKLRKQEKK